MDRIWLWVYYNKIATYPIFYLLKGTIPQMLDCPASRIGRHCHFFCPVRQCQFSRCFLHTLHELLSKLLTGVHIGDHINIEAYYRGCKGDARSLDHSSHALELEQTDVAKCSCVG